jgi:hypothetical protein
LARGPSSSGDPYPPLRAARLLLPPQPPQRTGES